MNIVKRNNRIDKRMQKRIQNSIQWSHAEPHRTTAGPRMAQSHAIAQQASQGPSWACTHKASLSQQSQNIP